jgi:RNA polymerase sigma-70 factor (ECF subfamily)
VLASRRVARSGSAEVRGKVGARSARGVSASRLHAAGRAQHPGIELGLPAFADYLASHPAIAGQEIDDARAGDLYLACAALTGDRVAVSALQRACAGAIYGYLKPFSGGRAFVAEVAQDLWGGLLAGSPGAAPKLRAYSGRGPLVAFIGISAQRIALRSLRREDAGARVATRAASERERISTDTELGYIKRRYRAAFEACIEEALAALDDHSRMILRLYFVDGVSLERLGTIYGVAASTISRRLVKTRARVSRRTRELIAARLHLTPNEAESLWNVMRSQLDLSVSRLFGEA